MCIFSLLLQFFYNKVTTSLIKLLLILKMSVVSWRGARPDVRMHPLRCRQVRHPPPPPLLALGGESLLLPEFTS